VDTPTTDEDSFKESLEGVLIFFLGDANRDAEDPTDLQVLTRADPRCAVIDALGSEGLAVASGTDRTPALP